MVIRVEKWWVAPVHELGIWRIPQIKTLLCVRLEIGQNPLQSAKSFAPLKRCPPMICRATKSMVLRGRANRAALPMLCERALTGNTILRTAQRGRKSRAG
jgi:hypothetical protein